MEVLPDFDHGQPSPEYLAAVERMRGRYLATGQANAPEGSLEARSTGETRRFWQQVWGAISWQAKPRPQESSQQERPR